MKKQLLIFAIVLLAGLCNVSWAQQPVTLNTNVGSTGYTGTNSCGTGAAGNCYITFLVENGSAVPIVLDEVGLWTGTANNGNTVDLYVSTTSLSGPITGNFLPATPPAGWSLAATGVIGGITATQINTVLTNIGFNIPANTSYRFSIVPSGTVNYSGTGAGTASPNSFNSVGNNVFLRVGDFQIGGLNVGYGGTNNPRFFTGSITYRNAVTANNDIGVASIDTPATFVSGNSSVVATIRNYGKNQVTSANINWSINGVLQNPVSWNGLLDTLNGQAPNTAIINLGTNNFTTNTIYNIKAWTSLPNGITDTVLINDTATKIIRSPLSGTFTVGVGGTFTTITEAANAATIFGVNGPVVFSLIDNNYSTNTGEVFPINIRSIPGNSPTNTITFKPANGVTSLIEATTANMFNLNGSSYVVFDGSNNTGNTRDLTIKNYNTTGVVFTLVNDANNNTLRNMNLLSANTGTASGTIVISGSSGFLGNDNNTIQNNYFGRSSTGVFAVGIISTGQSNIVQNNNNSIIGNDFNSFSFNGISITGTNTGNGSNWLITNNNFYDTASNTLQTTTWSAINFVPGTGSGSVNNQILNNIVGGDAPLALAGPFTNNSAITRVPIQVTVANGTPTRVYGNQIKNWNLNNTTATTQFTGIQLSGGVANIDSNYIGDVLSLNNAVFVGINAIPASNYDVTRNIVSNVSLYNTGTSAAIRAITTSSGQVVNINNNIIKGLRTNSGNTGSTTAASLIGISSQSSSNSVTISGNLVGSFAEPLTNNNTSTSAVRIIGILSTSGISVIENNTIDGLFMDSTGCTSTGTTSSAAINGILNISGSAGQIIRNNTVRHLYQRSTLATQSTQINGICYASGGFTIINNNVVYGLFSRSSNISTSTSAALNGINFGSSGRALVLNNYIDSLALNTPTASSTQVNGMVIFGTTGNRVYGNQIKSIYNRFTTSSPGICGIQYISGVVNQECDSNVIWGLYNLHTATTGSIIGIRYSASSATTGNESFCNRNFIHSFASAGTSATNLLGIDLQSMHGTVANNLIRLGIDTAGNAYTGPFVVSGINNNHSSSTFINRILHNTVYIGGAPTSGTSTTAAYRASIGFISWSDIRNNIFVNVVQNNGGTGFNYAINYGSIASVPQFVCNYNILWAGNGLTNNFIGGGPGNAAFMTGTGGWKRISQRDINSIHANPNLIAPAAAAGSINMNVASSNPGEGAGDPTLVAFSPIDFNGNQRSNATPVDIGAFGSATNTLSFDSVAPEITFTPLTNTASVLNRTITATIIDRNSGVDFGTFAPRLYFNKNNGTWANVLGALTSGNSRNGTWEFTIDYSLVGGVVPNDIIRYYVAAQDSAVNYSTQPAYGVGSDIANITNPPQTPNQYQISTPIPTTITVGPTGTYTTLTGPTGLFNAINNSLLQGNTVVTLENGATITETGSISLNQWLETNGTSVGNFGYTLTIRPAGPTQTILTGNVALTDGIIKFNGADRVQLLGYATNGLVTDTNLVIRNTATSQPALTLLNDASDIFIQGVIFETNNTSTSTFNGGAVRISQTSAITGNDNVYVGNCYFRRAPGAGGLPGILFAASGTTGVNRENDNLLIENSVFYGFNFNAINIGTGTGNNYRIKNNVFFQDTLNNHTTSPTVINFTPGALSNNDTISGNVIGGNWYGLMNNWNVINALGFTGISVSAGANTGTFISNNRISNVNMNNVSASTFTGIQVNSGGGVATITNNYIGDTLNLQSIFNRGNTTSLGINCQTGSNTIINNNIVSGIFSSATTISSVTVNGIRAWNQTGLLQINNNLVSNLRDSSSLGGTTTSAPMVGINVSSSTTSIQINNNRVSNLLNANIGAVTAQTLGILSTSGLATVTNNIVEQVTTNVQNTSTTTSASLIGIFVSSFNPGQIINNNIVRHLNVITATPNSTQLIGIMQSSGSGHTLNENIVHNLKSNSTSSNTSTASSIIGIMHNGSGSQININQNRVYALETIGLTGANNIVGILYQGTTTNVLNSVSRNFVHSFKSSTTGIARLIGIQQNSGSFTRYANNMIRLGIDSAGTLNGNNYEVYGFLNDVSGNFEYYHNSVYLAGSPSAGSSITACIRLNGIPSGTNVNDLRNNIFVNATSNTGTSTGKHFAIRLAGFPANATSLISNYNILQTPGTGGIIGGTALLDYPTLGGLTGWARNTLYDLQSGSANPLFVNATGDANTVDLHLQSSNPAEASGDQGLIGVVTVDFDGNARTGLAGLDVGADADAFTSSADIFPPSMTYTAVSNQGSITGPVQLTNVIVRDNKGMPLGGGINSPRIYYKKGINGLWVSNPATSSTGTPSQANYSFEILYGSVAGVTTGDTIFYYVVAEDSVASNLTSQRPLALGTNVNNITNEPSALDFYVILPTIPANSKFYVGAGQTYPTLTGVGGFFEFLNNNTLGGSITAVITSNINEPGTVALNQLGEDGVGAGSYTITIRPDSSTTTSRLIFGNSMLGLIRLNGADRIKISGVPDLSSNNNLNLLTIRNTSSSGPAVLFVNGATQNRLNNLTIESANVTSPAAVNGGAISFAGTNTTIGNSQDSITNCTIRNDLSATFPNGIPAGLISSFHGGFVLNSSNIITGNNFLNASSVYVNVDGGSGNNWVVSGNHFYNTLALITANALPIRFNGGAISEGHTISNNFIGGSAPNAGGAAWNSSVLAAWNCIQVAVGNNLTTQISSNTIRNMRFIQTASSVQWNGIIVTAGRTNITGNMIGDSTVAGSIELAPPTTHNGIAVNTTVTVPTLIDNNRIAGIAINSSGNSVSFNGILVAGGITSITNNIIGATNTANSITNNANGTTRAISVSTAVNIDPAVQITGNSIANINANASQTSVSLGGIQMSGSTVANISNNSIFNLSTLSTNTTFSSTGLTVFGISLAGSTNAGPMVNNNLVYNIAANSTSASTTNAAGIMIQSANAARVNGNRVYDIRNLSTSNAANPMATASGVLVFNVVNAIDVTNNQITLGDGQTNNIQYNGIWQQSSGGFDVNAYYNTVLITGNSSSGSLASYAYHKGQNSTTEVTSGTRLVNNAFINNRTGAATKNYAIANEVSGTPTGAGWAVVNYNLLSSSNANTVGMWGTADLNISNWRTSSNADRNSWSEISSLVNPTALFANVTNGNLNVVSSATQNWYLNGKGIAGALSGAINADFSGNSRGTTIGFGTDIGAHEFVSTSTPPAATITGTPSLNGTTTITFAGRTLATINWGATGSVPSSLTANYYSGVNPPSTNVGTRFMNAYLQVSATGGTGYSYQATFNYDPALLGSVLSETALRWARFGTSWSFDAASTPNAASQTITTSTSNNGFGIITGTDASAPLPVQMLTFTGEVLNDDAKLNWITASERNNLGFEIERSSDGRTFEYVGFVKGAGNSNIKRNYQFVDANVFNQSSVVYYRLKQIDVNGGYEYSNTIELNKMQLETFAVTPYPNPFLSTLNLKVNTPQEGNAQITVFDLNGKLVFSKTTNMQSGINVVNMDELVNSDGGIYFVEVKQASFVQVQKVVRLK